MKSHQKIKRKMSVAALRERRIKRLARLTDCDVAMLREKIEADMAKLAALKRGRS
jgi:hypothetical protein